MLTIEPDPVSSTVVHNSGTVVATCSGQRAFLEDDYSEDEDETDGSGSSENESTSSQSIPSTRSTSRVPDNSLKLWSL